MEDDVVNNIIAMVHAQPRSGLGGKRAIVEYVRKPLIL